MLLNFLPHDINLDSENTSIKRGSIYSMCLIHKNKRIIFKCSAKLLPLSLENIAIKLELPIKLELDHNTVNSESIHDVDFQLKSLEYCKRDVEITFKFLKKLDYCLLNTLPYWKSTVYTISGLSLKIFLRLFNSHKINVKLLTFFDEKIRPSYYGGRCEVFGNSYKDEFVYHYDFSGMYSNRLTEEYPISDPIEVFNPSNIDIPGFYYVDVASLNFEIPILPYKFDVSRKLVFPNGNFSGLYWHEELKLFIDNGAIIKKIHWGIIFEKSGYPFKIFAEYCIKSRKNSKIDNILWKLIPNSFVGRLGLRFDNEKTIILKFEDYDPRDYCVISDRLICNRWLVRIKIECQKKKTMNSNVIYASITTSKARILWWKSAMKVVQEGGRILYCDTDSLFVAFKKELNNKEKYSIPWEFDKLDTYVIRSCFFSSKFYYVINKNDEISIKLKGVPQNKTINFNVNEYEEKFYKNLGSIKFKFLYYNKGLLNMKIDEIEKEISLIKYDKRVFSKDKKTSKPLELV